MTRAIKEVPDGLTHTSSVFLPGQSPVEFYAYPIAKAIGRLYCKYCYKTHCDWWQMDPKDYDRDDVLLCGKCTHTSCRENME
jgi:hypothetical protein